MSTSPVCSAARFMAHWVARAVYSVGRPWSLLESRGRVPPDAHAGVNLRSTPLPYAQCCSVIAALSHRILPLVRNRAAEEPCVLAPRWAADVPHGPGGTTKSGLHCVSRVALARGGPGYVRQRRRRASESSESGLRSPYTQPAAHTRVTADASPVSTHMYICRMQASHQLRIARTPVRIYSCHLSL